jgi:hypothetical protein
VWLHCPCAGTKQRVGTKMRSNVALMSDGVRNCLSDARYSMRDLRVTTNGKSFECSSEGLLGRGHSHAGAPARLRPDVAQPKNPARFCLLLSPYSLVAILWVVEINLIWVVENPAFDGLRGMARLGFSCQDWTGGDTVRQRAPCCRCSWGLCKIARSKQSETQHKRTAEVSSCGLQAAARPRRRRGRASRPSANAQP